MNNNLLKASLLHYGQNTLPKEAGLFSALRKSFGEGGKGRKLTNDYLNPLVDPSTLSKTTQAVKSGVPGILAAGPLTNAEDNWLKEEMGVDMSPLGHGATSVLNGLAAANAMRRPTGKLLTTKAVSALSIPAVDQLMQTATSAKGIGENMEGATGSFSKKIFKGDNGKSYSAADISAINAAQSAMNVNKGSKNFNETLETVGKTTKSLEDSANNLSDAMQLPTTALRYGTIAGGGLAGGGIGYLLGQLASHPEVDARKARENKKRNALYTLIGAGLGSGAGYLATNYFGEK